MPNFDWTRHWAQIAREHNWTLEREVLPLFDHKRGLSESLELAAQVPDSDRFAWMSENEKEMMKWV